MLGAWSDARRLVLRSIRTEEEKEEECQSAIEFDNPSEPLIRPFSKSASKSQGATPETTPRCFQRVIETEQKQLSPLIIQHANRRTSLEHVSEIHATNSNTKLLIDQTSTSTIAEYGSLNDHSQSLRSILHHQSSHDMCHDPSSHFGNIDHIKRTNSHSSVHFLDDDCDPLNVDQTTDPSFWHDCKVMRTQVVEHPFLGSLLLCVPIGVVSSIYQSSMSSSVGDLISENTLSVVVFLSNFLSIIPLAWVLGNVTEELAVRVGPTMGGFLNAAFGNLVELIVAISALRKGMIALVQQSLLGSILSNMLLVLGMSFLLGGLKYSNQYFNKGGANIFASMLLLACLALAVPSAYVGAFQLEANQADILDISRVSAVIIFSIYLMYMYFQMKTHTSLFESEPDLSLSPDDDVDEEPTMTLTGVLFFLAAVTLLIAVCSNVLIDSIQPITVAYSINESFVGIILLPIVGNAAEHATAITVAMRNKVDLSIGVAIGSSTQIALFVIPLCVLLGWVIDQPMTLDFGEFATVALVMSVLIVTFVVKDGVSNWLLGAFLIGSYIILATSFFFHPKTSAGGTVVRSGADIAIVND